MYCQCSETEYTEIVILLARTGGMDWSRKDYGYVLEIVLSLESCEFKSVLVSTHSAPLSFCLRCECIYSFLHILSLQLSPQSLIATQQQVGVYVPFIPHWGFWVFVSGGAAIFSLVVYISRNKSFIVT